MPQTTATVMAWVARYEAAWHAGDAAAVGSLFAPDARYRHSPYEPDLIGHAAIGAEWADPRPFRMIAEAVAVDGERAVVRVVVEYSDPDQEYSDLWLLRFGDDGRVTDFEEWAYWPGRPYSPR